ncbi:UNVERIFIED_ORG: polysaccharide deacetylase [Citrobacter freundii]
MRNAQHLPVLMYHHVSTKPGLVTLSPQTFRAQMQWLAEDGWLDNWLQVFPVLQVFNLQAHVFLVTGQVGEGAVRRAGELPDYSHKECEERIEQGRVDEVMLRWSEVREMHHSGLVSFHLHTHTHNRWDTDE